MKVSCIIPFHDPGPFLRPAVESVLGQDHPPDEVILVDDGSSDGSAELVESSTWPVVLLRQAHAGVAAARNRGLAAASGDVIAFHDADDVWPRARMRVLVGALEADADIDVVVGRVEVIAERILSREETSKLDGVHLPLSLPSMLVRRRLFDRVGPFNETLAVAEDAEFFMRARIAGVAVRLVDETSLLYRRHDRNMSHDIGRMQSGMLDALHSLSTSRKVRV